MDNAAELGKLMPMFNVQRNYPFKILLRAATLRISILICYLLSLKELVSFDVVVFFTLADQLCLKMMLLPLSSENFVFAYTTTFVPGPKTRRRRIWYASPSLCYWVGGSPCVDVSVLTDALARSVEEPKERDVIARIRDVLTDACSMHCHGVSYMSCVLLLFELYIYIYMFVYIHHSCILLQALMLILHAATPSCTYAFPSACRDCCGGDVCIWCFNNSLSSFFEFPFLLGYPMLCDALCYSSCYILLITYISVLHAPWSVSHFFPLTIRKPSLSPKRWLLSSLSKR